MLIHIRILKPSLLLPTSTHKYCQRDTVERVTRPKAKESQPCSATMSTAAIPINKPLSEHEYGDVHDINLGPGEEHSRDGNCRRIGRVFAVHFSEIREEKPSSCYNSFTTVQYQAESRHREPYRKWLCWSSCLFGGRPYYRSADGPTSLEIQTGHTVDTSGHSSETPRMNHSEKPRFWVNAKGHQGAVIGFDRRQKQLGLVYNMCLFFGQACAAVPIALYRHMNGPPWSGHSDGSCVSSAADTFVIETRQTLQQLAQSTFPSSFAKSLIDPDPPIFISACVVLGILLSGQYALNAHNKLQGPALLAGAMIGLWFSIQSCSTDGMLATAFCTLPIATVLCMTLGQIADSIRSCL
ncbi:hypothetical protein OPT61_g7471 [Boeremia exigua]|uniref:Uncharacterized protein n=1 Tax=Boeremia exigua TaxID=749465 RepID=A0ACC2I3U2_9PLEO|nr:hypothetical protein OPT61_g7471 [Boeremia exigua]